MNKAVLFDIDGTLLDAHSFIFDAVKYALTVSKTPYPTSKYIKKAMGKALKEFYKALVPKADFAALAKIHRDFQEKTFHTLKPFPKVKKTLQYLKTENFKIAAVSNRTRESLLRSLRFTKIADFFDAVVSAEDVKNPKPHQEHLLVALQQLEVEPGMSYMVGDTDQDILAGKNAGVKTIGVTYGFSGKDIKKHHPDYLADDIGQILDIVLKLGHAADSFL